MPQKKATVTPLDAVILAAITLALALVVYRLFYLLNYQWNWRVILTYLVRFDPERGRWTTNILLDGLLTTIRLSVWAMVFATLAGFAIGLARLSSRLLFRLLGRTYVEAVRNTPPLVLIFLFYYFVCDRLLAALGVEETMRACREPICRLLCLVLAEPAMINQFLSGVVTLALFQAAYIAEIVRAGVRAVDGGQVEAGKAIGLTNHQVLRLIVMPQALRIMLPPLAGEFINTIKWSSIVSIISIQELTFQGLQVMASTRATIEVWLTVSLMYLVLCLSLSLAVRRLERAMSRQDLASPRGC